MKSNKKNNPNSGKIINLPWITGKVVDFPEDEKKPNFKEEERLTKTPKNTNISMFVSKDSYEIF